MIVQFYDRRTMETLFISAVNNMEEAFTVAKDLREIANSDYIDFMRADEEEEHALEVISEVYMNYHRAAMSKIRQAKR